MKLFQSGVLTIESVQQRIVPNYEHAAHWTRTIELIKLHKIGASCTPICHTKTAHNAFHILMELKTIFRSRYGIRRKTMDVLVVWKAEKNPANQRTPTKKHGDRNKQDQKNGRILHFTNIVLPTFSGGAPYGKW